MITWLSQSHSLNNPSLITTLTYSLYYVLNYHTHSWRFLFRWLVFPVHGSVLHCRTYSDFIQCRHCLRCSPFLEVVEVHFLLFPLPVSFCFQKHCWWFLQIVLPTTCLNCLLVCMGVSVDVWGVQESHVLPCHSLYTCFTRPQATLPLQPH